MSPDDSSWLESTEESFEGQLAIDSYQTEEDVIVEAPIAGVDPSDIEISITDEVVTIKGQRVRKKEIPAENYFAEECYWGTFSKSFILPVPVEPDLAKADLKNGILTITIPKQSKTKTRIIKVEGS